MLDDTGLGCKRLIKTNQKQAVQTQPDMNMLEYKVVFGCGKYRVNLYFRSVKLIRHPQGKGASTALAGQDWSTKASIIRSSKIAKQSIQNFTLHFNHLPLTNLV